MARNAIEINIQILKNCPTCNQCICHFDGRHTYRCSGCNMKVHMTQLNMFSNHRYVLRPSLFSHGHEGPRICTSHSRCTTMTYLPPPPPPKTMSVTYGDNFWHHSQSFRIMVKGWKWNPRIWYDMFFNWLSTHNMSCKYSHVDQGYDGMHLLTHWTTLYVMHERYARILSFQWRGHFENSQ